MCKLGPEKDKYIIFLYYNYYKYYYILFLREYQAYYQFLIINIIVNCEILIFKNYLKYFFFQGAVSNYLKFIKIG